MEHVDWNVYLRVSTLMFLEFAIWGAWMPVLAMRLLGPMKLNGKQTGWIYATFPLASIFSPFISGYLADKCINAEYVILGCHALERCSCLPPPSKPSSGACSGRCSPIPFVTRPQFPSSPRFYTLIRLTMASRKIWALTVGFGSGRRFLGR